MLAPPSTHPSGAVYTWLDNRSAIADLPPEFVNPSSENEVKITSTAGCVENTSGTPAPLETMMKDDKFRELWNSSIG